MPRKTQFTTEDVINAAIEMVRKHGLPKLSAQAVADEMGVVLRVLRGAANN